MPSALDKTKEVVLTRLLKTSNGEQNVTIKEHIRESYRGFGLLLTYTLLDELLNQGFEWVHQSKCSTMW